MCDKFNRLDIEQYKLNVEQPQTIGFHFDGKEAGRLEMKDGSLVFTGDVDKSAKVFFDYLSSMWSDIYKCKNCHNEQKD